MQYVVTVTLPSDQHLKVVLSGLMRLTRAENIVGARIRVERVDDPRRNGSH